MWLRRGLLLTISILFAAYAASALAGWERTRWGMTPEQVQAAMSDTRPSNGEGLQGLRERSRGRYVFANIPLTAKYYYGDDGLGLISVDVPFRRCRDALAAIICHHGQPIRTSDQVILQLAIWHDVESNTRIRAMTSSARICSLYFEPLEAYRAGDLAGAALL